MDKKRKGISLLIIVGCCAFIFIFLSIFNNKDRNIKPIIENKNNEQEEKAKGKEEEVEPEDEYYETDEDFEEDDKIQSHLDENGKYEYEGINFVLSKSWLDSVSIEENNENIFFRYKNKYTFLELKVVSKIDWEKNEGYYKSYYKEIWEKDNDKLIYTVPSEHPLHRNKDSNDYKRLSVIMDQVPAFINTIN